MFEYETVARLRADLADEQTTRRRAQAAFIEAEAECTALRGAVVSVRKAAHYASKVLWTEQLSDETMDEIQRLIDDVTPNNTPGAKLLAAINEAPAELRRETPIETVRALVAENAALRSIIDHETPIAAFDLATSWRALEEGAER